MSRSLTLTGKPFSFCGLPGFHFPARKAGSTAKFAGRDEAIPAAGDAR
jgi:hypothetical protein